MPLPFQDKPGQLFDNADSFAMVFDEAWQKLLSQPKAAALSADEKKRLALDACAAADALATAGHAVQGLLALARTPAAAPR